MESDSPARVQGDALSLSSLHTYIHTFPCQHIECIVMYTRWLRKDTYIYTTYESTRKFGGTDTRITVSKWLDRQRKAQERCMYHITSFLSLSFIHQLNHLENCSHVNPLMKYYQLKSHNLLVNESGYIHCWNLIECQWSHKILQYITPKYLCRNTSIRG